MKKVPYLLLCQSARKLCGQAWIWICNPWICRQMCSGAQHTVWHHCRQAKKDTIMKTRLYNVNPLKPHFYIVKLGFTGVYIIFLISAQKHSLCFEQKYEKYQIFYLKIFIFFLVVKFSVYLNRLVFIMPTGLSKGVCFRNANWGIKGSGFRGDPYKVLMYGTTLNYLEIWIMDENWF